MNKYLILIMLLAVGCATKNTTSEYQVWSAQPTPHVWNEKSKWNIVLLDDKGSIARNLTLKFTSDPAETCTSGNFKKIEILSEYPKRSEKFIGVAAYEIKGSALIIDLSSNLCDAGNELRGQVSEIGLEGNHQTVSANGTKVVGRFYGVPLN